MYPLSLSADSLAPRTRGTVAALRALMFGCAAVSGLSLLVTASDPPDPLGWLADLAVHWQWLYLAACVTAAILLSWIDRPRWWFGAPGVAICLIGVFNASPALDRTNSQVPQLRVATANLHYGNLDVSPFIAWLEEQRPDLVFLQEVSPTVVQQLSDLVDYPTFLIDSSPEPFTLAVLAKQPLRDVEAVAGTPGLVGQKLAYRFRMLWEGQEIVFSAVHLAAPITADYRRQRDRLLVETADWAARANSPVLVAGDFNTTPWSAAMRRAASMGLRRATGLMPTWPTLSWSTPLIPIDHVLGSMHWAVKSRQRGPHIGSDHRPVIVALTLLGPPRKQPGYARTSNRD